MKVCLIREYYLDPIQSEFSLNLFLATSPISFLLCLSNFISYSVSLLGSEYVPGFGLNKSVEGVSEPQDAFQSFPVDVIRS